MTLNCDEAFFLLCLERRAAPSWESFHHFFSKDSTPSPPPTVHVWRTKTACYLVKRLNRLHANEFVREGHANRSPVGAVSCEDETTQSNASSNPRGFTLQAVWVSLRTPVCSPPVDTLANLGSTTTAVPQRKPNTKQLHVFFPSTSPVLTGVTIAGLYAG